MSNSYGGKFILLDPKQFSLPGTNNRFYHLATILYGVREFMFMMDMVDTTTYIEEITGGNLSKIEDDELWQALAEFIQEKSINRFTNLPQDMNMEVLEAK